MPDTGGYADPLIFAAISYIIYGLLSGLFSRGMMGGMYGYSGIREFGFSQLYLYIVGGMIVHNVSMAKSAIALLLPTFLILAAVAAVFLYPVFFPL